MYKKSQIDRMLVLFYRSASTHSYTHFNRPDDWLDQLPMDGLEKLVSLFDAMREDVLHEIEQRLVDGITKVPRGDLEAVHRGETSLDTDIGIQPKQGL